MSGGPDFHRLGPLRLSDLAQVVRGGDDYHVTYAGLSKDGTPLFSVYRRRRGG